MDKIKINLIDFGTVELPSNFKVITYAHDSMTYMGIKRKLERYEGTNDFGRWFCLNLEINNGLLCRGLPFDKCLSLAYLLKKVEESNEELKELVRTWREDESKLSSVTKFLINNTCSDSRFVSLSENSSQIIQTQPLSLKFQIFI